MNLAPSLVAQASKRFNNNKKTLRFKLLKRFKTPEKQLKTNKQS